MYKSRSVGSLCILTQGHYFTTTQHPRKFKIAKLMVTTFGMSDKLGVKTYGDISKQSPETQAAIEQEDCLTIERGQTVQCLEIGGGWAT